MDSLLSRSELDRDLDEELQEFSSQSSFPGTPLENSVLYLSNWTDISFEFFNSQPPSCVALAPLFSIDEAVASIDVRLLY